uniref:Uncharacterized protein n=1 Tax=Strigamia maritima TaxID=126957 RepID=T1J9C0_STRMM
MTHFLLKLNGKLFFFFFHFVKIHFSTQHTMKDLLFRPVFVGQGQEEECAHVHPLRNYPLWPFCFPFVCGKGLLMIEKKKCELQDVPQQISTIFNKIPMGYRCLSCV